MNKYTFLWIWTLLCFCFPIHSSAQVNPQSILTGTVTDPEGEALVYANIFLIQDPQTQKIVAHSTTDTDGKFLLEAPAGEYLMGISFLGFKMHTQSVVLKAEETLNLGKIVLEEDATEVQTVVVMGEAIKVRTLPNGFSVNVNKLRDSSNDALDLLRRLPNLQVKGEELSVVGKKNVVIQIGNVLQRVSAKEVASILKGYDPKLIESVEVQMQPALRYDPDGNTAMIILHTSSIFKEYMGGIVGSELMKGAARNDRYAGYGTLLYNRNKLYWSISPAGNYNSSYMKENLTYTYPQRSFKLITPSDGNSTYMGGNATLQYQHHKNGHIGITASINKRKIDNLFESQELNMPETTQYPNLSTQNGYISRVPKMDATAYWEQTFGVNKHKFWLEVNYFNYKDNADADYESRRITNKEKQLTYQDRDRLSVTGWGVNNDYSFLIDTQGNYKVDLGIKLLSSRTIKERKHNQWTAGNVAETFGQEDKMTLNELWVTPYISSTLRFSKVWWLRVGLRTAFTHREIGTKQGNEPNINHISWLPSLHISYTPNQTHKFSFTINTSAKQPNFSQLNPFEWRTSQQTYSKGNTKLSPQLNYKYDLGYVYKGALSISAVIKQGRHLFSSISTVDERGRIYSQPENAQNSVFWGVETSYYWDQLNWINTSISAHYGKTKYTSHHPQLIASVSGDEWGINGYASFVFNKQRTCWGYIEGEYTGKQKTTMATTEPQYEFGAGISHSFLQRRLTVSLAGMSLFASRFKGYSLREHYRIDFNHRFSYPTLYFSVSYKFSKGKDRSIGRNLNTKDIERRL